VPTAPPSTTAAETRSLFESLVEGDKRSRSWREKLEAVRELIAREDSRLDEEALGYVAIYLRFLSAGQIACVEDGRHFRPGHHARISQEIRERLEKVSTPADAPIIRKIYAALPSSAQVFQRPEPLTRIRDIAHRNDIPSELKREIKTTLQNKLHRCAGPEDLDTSAKLLERITAPGTSYSADFVEQFRIFHEELKEFFNAQTLAERLKALVPWVDSRQAELIREFGEGKSSAGFSEQLSTLKRLTELRESFELEIQKQTNGNRQEFMLADIGLEDFAFVLLSQLINAFESSEPRRSGTELLEPLALTIRNLELSAISADECGAISAELHAWRENLDPGDREQLLRLKATVERCRRLAERYSEQVISSLLSKADKLGRALGVAEHAIRVFSEAEIRSHSIFQLSKLVSHLSRRLRGALELPGWDTLVSGTVVGRVKVGERLDGIGAGSEPVIAVLKQAEGDEEIPKAVRGILLAHEIPHLSHLGVRARQAGVVFAGAEDDSNLKELQDLNNQTIRLIATPDKVQWTKIAAGEIAAGSDRVNIPRVRPGKVNALAQGNGSSLIVPIDEVTVEIGGQKAFGLRRLREMSSNSRQKFLVPNALVIPFGVMEKTLSAKKGLSEEYWRLAGEMDSSDGASLSGGPEQGGGREGVIEQLRHLIERLEVPVEITSNIGGVFRDERLMVRSSANCEDLEDFAGAVASAIRRVWSSLWTRRAVLSRKQAGIRHEQARMAVIIQQMIAPDYSFVLHTVNPLSHRADEVYAELALGLGETLASAAARGTPYRLVCNKESGDVQTLAFANFSHALLADSRGGVRRELLDYSRVSLSRESESRKDLGRQLAAIGSCVENGFNKAQDIEGAIMGNKIYLVQSRPQQGL
jgi:phosphoglucan,water dikinase